MSSVPMPWPWCDGATHTGATPATAARCAVEAAGRGQHVRHHHTGVISHQLDERRRRTGGPRAADDGELLGGVPGVVGEGRGDHGEDSLFVSRARDGADEHGHGSRTPTLTM